MKLKMVGLGKMGFNLALNMKDHEVDVEGFDVNEEARKKAEESGIKSYETLKDLVSADQKDVIWVMLPAGKITNSVLDELSGLCKKGDIVIDGGNSDHRDSLKTAKKMEEKGIYFFDIGTSGGVYGARHGASFMCGGDPEVFKNDLQEMLESIATTNGCLYTGKTGSGHYLKMIHNAMLYGYMQTLGEGFELLEKSEFDYIESTGNSKVDALFKQWNEEIRMIDKRNKDDMKVLGEIVLTADKVEQGIYKNRIKSSSDNPTISTLKSTLNKMLDSVQDSNARILRVVSSYTNDDFTDSIKVADHYKDDMKLLMESINVLGNALSKNAKTNFSNGETLEKNANIMTSSMNSLSSKANNQAASLEETAAALEEITSITRNNAQNAAKMAELGQTVKKSVFTGEELASRTASSMDEINQKVNSINEAITVIDQIAFQTNILSLNAAVEAATAGEAGKGFAVVAAEVRNLASRSAEAAREIKHLVQEATVKANDGKTVSSDMIDGYKELNKNISETIHIIEDVSKASKEQMMGIEQINDSVNMLDRVTQENASEANNVKSIANNISLLANDLLNDAKSKKFN